MIPQNGQAALMTVEDIIRTVVGDPRCRRMGCHGKGYLGVRIEDGGKQTVMLCECARVGESDYSRLSALVRDLMDEVKSLRADVEQTRNDLLNISVYLTLMKRQTVVGAVQHNISRFKERLDAKRDNPADGK